MRAVVALGNPGPQYAVSRHNAGFLLADVLREQWGFPAFRREGPALVSRGRWGGGEVALLKPQTYMNRSGVALRPLLHTPAFAPSRDLLVLVDDLALPLGGFRLRARGSAGGHNGLVSVEDELQSQEYARLRIGIGPLPEGEDQAEWVLQPLARQELNALVELLPELADAVECWLDEDIETAMNRYNRRGQERD